MHEDERTDSARPADDQRVRDQPEAQSSTPSSSRRPFLKTLALPPFVAALAGCEVEVEEDVGDEPRTDAPVSGETVAFAEAIRFDESFGMEAVVRSAEDTETRLTGRVDQDDHYVRVEHDGDVSESTVVDGTAYLVTDEGCFEYRDVAAGRDGEAGASEDVAEDAGVSSEVTLAGTTTIDDRETLVFELPAGELDGYEEALTYYVDADTRYMRRLETGAAVVDYHSWGDVDPIDVPDRDCRQPEIPTGTSNATATPRRAVAVPGEVVENTVDGLEILAHEPGAGDPGFDTFDPEGFYVAVVVRNTGDEETDLLNYGYEVVPFDEDGNDRSTSGTSKRSLTGSADGAYVGPGETGAVVVYPTRPGETVEGGPSAVARYEVSLTCGRSSEGVYCDE